MQLPTPLIPARLIQRYKRFLVDAIPEEGPDGGTTITAHLADPGRLPGLAVADARIWLSHHTNPKRRLAYSVQLIEQGATKVAVNSANANRLVAEGLADGTIDHWGPLQRVLREPRIEAGTRHDFKLTTQDGTTIWLEVKNVTWRRADAADNLAAFPDAVTARGSKHLRSLANLAEKGERAALLFIAQRSDVDALSIAGDIDPAYADAFRYAQQTGVEIRAHACQINHDEISIHRTIPLVE